MPTQLWLESPKWASSLSVLMCVYHAVIFCALLYTSLLILQLMIHNFSENLCWRWRQRWMKCLFQRFPPCYHWNEGWTKKPKVISLSISIIRHFGNILPQFGTIAELSLNWCVFRANGALPRPNEIVSYFLDCFLVLLYLWFDGYSTAKEPRILAIYHIVASCIITPREKFLQKNKF